VPDSCIPARHDDAIRDLRRRLSTLAFDARSASGAAILAVLVLLLGVTPPAPVIAQNPPPGDNRTVVPRDTAHGERRQTLFTYRDAILAGGLAVLTVAMFPLDENVARQIRQDSTFNGFTQKSAVGFETISSRRRLT
jgi:hypothetical protein